MARVDEIRERSGLSIQELCRRGGIDRAQMTKWRNGRASAGLVGAVKIAQGLGVPVEAIVSSDS
jgi:transcriptional regulator with XRE-family HTH domain